MAEALAEPEPRPEETESEAAEPERSEPDIGRRALPPLPAFADRLMESEQAVLTAPPPRMRPARQIEPEPEPESEIQPEPVAQRAPEPMAASFSGDGLGVDRLMYAEPDQSRRGEIALKAAWAASFLALAVLLWAGYEFRTDIMAGWPASERLYAALGLA